MGRDHSTFVGVEMITLFAGAFLQWYLTALFTLLAVERSRMGVFVTVLLLQAMWWFNIQHVVRTENMWHGTAWCLGAAVGASAAGLRRRKKLRKP